VLRDVPLRLLAVAGALTVLAACGKPPEPPLTGPPEASASASAGASGPAYPPSGLPGAAVPLPTGGLPPATVPYVPPATVPYVPPATLPPVVTTRPTTTTPTVTPAPKCRSGPTAAQVLAVLHGLPGIPDKELKVVDGPFCSGTWQFAQVQIADVDPDSAEQLFVVTTGKPAALKVLEAGTDVCSVAVQSTAPAGIRVRACGS
jgi:hypothetical protein